MDRQEPRMIRNPHKGDRARGASVLAPWLALVLLTFPMTAHAVDLSFKLEPGVAIPLTAPQSQIYEVGGGQSLKALFGLTSFLDIGPAVSFTFLPASRKTDAGGTIWGFGAGLRLKRPHDAVSAFGISPWLDADFLYIRTGNLNRPGFDAAIGVSIPIGESRTFWLGPFIRYGHVIQPDRAGSDNRDAKILTLGVSFEVGTGLERAREPAEVRTVTNETVVTNNVISCPDRDGDGVPDSIDRCPDVAGPIENWGCPNYKKVVIQKDKLELKEKIQFAWNTPKLEDPSFELLDEVAQALKENKGFRVQIEGHASSEGADDHNQTLSEQRAEAVLDYLVAHGVAKDRLVSKGFSSSVPIDTNATSAGREANRRVEFVVHFIILNEGGAK
jgi:outer membrane protein OmpA-like peptidoglycan-associated protein